jgi:hypothetical protein
LKIGLSFADTVYAKEAARRAGSAMPRMVEGEDGRKRTIKRREECVEIKDRKRAI